MHYFDSYVCTGCVNTCTQSTFFNAQYLAWRVLTGLHRTITISFMLVGHTKFAPDWCFGLFKQRYRRTFVSSLEDVVNVVDSSADVNVAQLVGTQSGETVVPMYRWDAFLSDHFRHVPHLKSYHHFKFSSASPGVVILQELSDSNSSSYPILVDEDWCPDSTELPPVIRPARLSHARQTYLYQQIRPFCREGTEDLTCPEPTQPETVARAPSSNSEDESEIYHPPQAKQAKRPRRCGLCGATGHTRRTCSSKK